MVFPSLSLLFPDPRRAEETARVRVRDLLSRSIGMRRSLAFEFCLPWRATDLALSGSATAFHPVLSGFGERDRA